MNKITLDEYRTYVTVENTLYKLGIEFLKYAKEHMPDGYNFFEISPISAIDLRDVRTWNESKIFIEFSHIFRSDNNFTLTLDVKDFLENVNDCAQKWLDSEKKLYDEHRECEIARRNKETMEKELAEYKRIKNKYNLD